MGDQHQQHHVQQSFQQYRGGGRGEAGGKHRDHEKEKEFEIKTPSNQNPSASNAHVNEKVEENKQT